MISDGGSFGQLSLHTGRDGRVWCCTYPDSAPILNITAATTTVAVCLGGKQISAEFVAVARGGGGGLIREQGGAAGAGPSGRPWHLPNLRHDIGEESHRMRGSRRGAVTGESFAQVNNPDPFAPPVWRSPVYRTPEFVIWLVQLVRLLGRAIWFVICHPLLDLVAGLLVLDYIHLGWPGLAGTAALVMVALVVLRLGSPPAVHPVAD